jgi:Xaa-Pro aminopeptidase
MSMATPPTRGFTQAEFEARTERTQRRVHDLEIDAMLLTVVSQLRYFSGFLTQFWHSPLEPGMEFAAGKLMAHEENIVITENGAEKLSKRAAAEISIIR